MSTYSMTVAGLQRELPICKVTDDLYIGAFICFGDAELTEACGRELLKLLEPGSYDYLFTAEAKSIPLIHEMARQSGADLTGGSIWYEKAQNWAKEKGISDGTNPNGTINRAQMVTMLWRTMGQPTAGGTANFTDVPADSYYAQAVAWAVENGITTGVGNGHFDPTGTCTRAQIAAFLARSMK